MKTKKHIITLVSLLAATALVATGCSALLDLDELKKTGNDAGVAKDLDNTKLEAGADAQLLEAGADAQPLEAGADMSDGMVVDQTVIDQAVIDQTVIDQTVIDQTVIDLAVTDQTVIDQTVIDQMVPDIMVPDQMVPDIMPPDYAVPDMPIPDMMQPDMMQPDQVVPDMMQPDQMVPDLAVVDQGSPDSTASTVDQAVTVDQATATVDAYIQPMCGTTPFPQAGCCMPGSQTAVTCASGAASFDDCSLNTNGNINCGWDPGQSIYVCATTATTDPSGMNPRDCNP